MSLLSNPFTSKRQQLDDLQREYDNMLNSYNASKAKIAANTVSGAAISAGTITAAQMRTTQDETTWIGITPVENGYLVKADGKTFVASTFDDVQKTIATVMVQMKLATSD